MKKLILLILSVFAVNQLIGSEGRESTFVDLDVNQQSLLVNSQSSFVYQKGSTVFPAVGYDDTEIEQEFASDTEEEVVVVEEPTEEDRDQVDKTGFEDLDDGVVSRVLKSNKTKRTAFQFLRKATAGLAGWLAAGAALKFGSVFCSFIFAHPFIFGSSIGATILLTILKKRNEKQQEEELMRKQKRDKAKQGRLFMRKLRNDHDFRRMVIEMLVANKVSPE